MRDIVNHYRTLVGEALMALDLGHAQEFVEETAYRWGRKIKPTPPPRPDFGGFEHLEDLGAYAEIMHAYIDDLAIRTAVPPQYFITEPDTKPISDLVEKYFEERQRPIVERADQLTVKWSEPVAQMFETLAAIEAGSGWPTRFVAGLDPKDLEGYVLGQVNNPEWVYLDRAALLKECHYDAAPGSTDQILGIPLYVDPDNDKVVRIKTADLMARPDRNKIASALMRFKSEGDVTPSE